MLLTISGCSSESVIELAVPLIAAAFKDRFSINYPLALDTNGEIAINFGVRALPEKFFIDNKGEILKKVIGPVNESQLNEILEELLSDK